jgi:predicted RNA binding protein YcfA (HicA-like mRNA interferase family)
MKVRDVIRMIEDDGWYFERQRGSHRIYRHAEKRGSVTVAGKPGQDMPPGTLGNILRQAGLRRPKQ